MVRKLVALSALALIAAPAFAETGGSYVGTVQVDNVTGMYGRAPTPAAKISGNVVTKGTDVNVSGRDTISSGDAKMVMSAQESLDQSFGRS